MPDDFESFPDECTTPRLVYCTGCPQLATTTIDIEQLGPMPACDACRRQWNEIHRLRRERPRRCPLCESRAVVPLTAEQLGEQPDETTHVCHPNLGGCNHGFVMSTTIGPAVK